ncbi:Coenzyme F420 hydrogenase/dehydrogenase, beta subunit C-terminal domain [Novosphingobium huizhouense]|uniref:Coenzyme F420 hydrogenase/dehydrogenase, beta subunit C-terminal domain n=1 Tax=Novosphingobium huizhouense TaxID=2866625 RepID=UPI001CD8C977|nr:Coenzyme F420 hydrogenase/dehydrogenase, beta subunit C-terminal domain [Novosphingobium huizhouense]
MTMRDPGFARPVQSRPLSPTMETLVAEACPGLAVASWDTDVPGAARGPDPLWGPALSTSVGHATDPVLRFAGASGGALSGLLAHALASGLVEAVLHVEPDPDDPLGNRMRWSRTGAEVEAGSGSRYAPSSPLAAIDGALAAGRRFAFVGKPCDVSALRRLALHDPRVAARVPLILSFYCGGLPSRRGAVGVVAAMGVSLTEVTGFRYRGNGWPGLARAVTSRGEERTMTYAQSWGEHLSREVQFRCKICPDAVGASADIACADAWFGDADGYPTFDEQDGRSLIQARTERGQAFLEDALRAAAVVAEPIDVSAIEAMQPFQARRKRAIRYRVAACKVLGRPVPEMRGTRVAEAARQAPLGERLRAFFGTLRRLARKSARS